MYDILFVHNKVKWSNMEKLQFWVLVLVALRLICRAGELSDLCFQLADFRIAPESSFADGFPNFLEINFKDHKTAQRAGQKEFWMRVSR